MRSTVSKSPVGQRQKEGPITVSQLLEAAGNKSPMKATKQDVRTIKDKLESTTRDNAENTFAPAKKTFGNPAHSNALPLKKPRVEDYQTDRQPLKAKTQNQTGTRSTSSLIGTPRKKSVTPVAQSPRSKSPVGKASPSFGSKQPVTKVAATKPYVEEDMHISDEDEQEGHSDGQRLIDGLKAACLRDNEYNTNKLVGEFAKIVHRAGARKTQDFMPENKCSVGTDGRKALKIGETRIFYDESIISQILDLGVRSKPSN